MKPINKNNKLFAAALSASILLSTNAFALSVVESDYYTWPAAYTIKQNFKNDYNVDNSFATDDSAELQKAIDHIATNGGGKLTIPAGNYTFSEVEMKSNVSLYIDAGATLRPTTHGLRRNDGTYRNYDMFRFTSSVAEPLRNVSIVGVNGRFTVDLTKTQNQNVRAFHFKHVNHFFLANVNIEDGLTKFAGIELSGQDLPSYVYSPRNGVIKNADIYKTRYGYGLVQVQLGTNVLFKNLFSEGGATLRLESHTKDQRDASRVDTIHKIAARDVRNEEGNSAVMLSPHFVNNGLVDIRNVTGINTGITVRVETGFVTPEEAELGLSAGKFSAASTVRNIKSTFTPNKAQLKTKHYKYLPCDLQATASPTLSADGESYQGPSIASVIYDTNYSIDINSSYVTKATGFRAGQKFVTEDNFKNCN